MTAKDIRMHRLDELDNDELNICFWLREIAAQLAEMNEAAQFLCECARREEGRP